MVFDRAQPFVYPTMAALVFALTFAASLFFNGVRIEYFALSLFILFLLLYVVLWRGYSRGLQTPKTPLAITLTLFWSWLAVTQLWSHVPYVSMINFWWVGGAVLVFWLMTLVRKPSHFFPGIYIATLAIGVVLALLSAYQQLSLGMHAQSTFLTRNSHAGLMCLFAVPVSSHFLLAHGTNRAAVWKTYLLGSVLFVLHFSLALTGSRGATLGLLTGLAVVIGVAYRRVPRQRLALFVVIVLTAYLLANILQNGEVGARLGTLAKLGSADAGRFLIWERAWQMLMDAPWWGVGLGTYWLHWPPYRNPLDSSGGFYVHNDYLQIWIETGLPGLLLLLAVYAAVLITFLRLLRYRKMDPAVTLESAGLFGGLLAIAVHTFFDFDLYILPIQLVMGLVLIRLHALYLAHVPADVHVIQPAQWIGRRAYRIISFLVLLLPLMYFAALGGSAVLTYKARDLMAQGQWVAASETLSRAAQLMPTSDLIPITHADMLRQAITQLPRGATERAVLFKEAFALLEGAEKANPFRSQIFFIRGLLYTQNPDLAGGDWAVFAARAYAAALKRDPLAFWAREAYAGLLMWQGKSGQAKQILEEGADYQYVGTAAVNYLVVLARLRRQAGEPEHAAVLEKKLSEMTGQPVGPLAQPSMSLARPKPSSK